MGFNYGKERYHTEKEFARFAKTCREAGMSEDAIAEMYRYDREVLNSDRRYYTHTQPYYSTAFSGNDAEEYEEGRSPLHKSYLEQCSVQPEIHHSGRYGWLEDIDTPALLLWLKALSDNDLELLTLIVFDGKNQNEVAREWHCSEAAISKRMKRLRKSLEKLFSQG